jgi:hypothetical protein
MMAPVPLAQRCALLLALAGASLAALAGPAAAAPRKVPFGFMGIDASGVLVDPSFGDQRLNAEFAQMARTGVESVRIAVYWSGTQPYANAAAVPPDQAGQFQDVGGIPTDWSASDRLYQAAAAHGLQVLPTIVQAPAWARLNPALPWSPPADAAAFGRFVGLVVARYGPNGGFWTSHPTLPAQPTRSWQIWNEPIGGKPNTASEFWQDPGHPPEARYLGLLRAARLAIRAADPQGQVILASLFGYAWLDLADLYSHGAHALFDGVAINMFTHRPSSIVLALTYTRHVMNRNGDRRLPLMLTEFSWPTAKGRGLGYNATPAQSAHNLTVALKDLTAVRQKLNLRQVFYYTWLTPDSGVDLFDYAGMRRLDASTMQITSKPSVGAYQIAARRLEGCAKALLANACA